VAQILQLYQLQSLDIEIQQTRQQLAQIAAALGESEALRQVRAAHNAAETLLRQAQTTVQDLDLELKSLNSKISGQEKLLYSGKVLSAKEASNLQEEVAALKRWQADREDHLLDAMVEQEEAEAGVEAAAEKLAEIETAWRNNQHDLLVSQEEQTHKLSELEQRRPSMTAQVSPDLLTTYEKMRPKKAGRPVAAVKDSACQGCGVTVSANKIRQARAKTELIYCGTCGRILYVP
jgi:predicted  nucleic acid-binding Zn-ribbon protein